MRTDHRVLIVGGSGFVGRNLVEFFTPGYAVTATFFRTEVVPAAGIPARWLQLDARRQTDVDGVVEKVRPELVIHSAGNKNVRWCQDHPQEATALNGESAACLARACQRTGARFIYLSTDLVFEGTRGNYQEHEVATPATVYGQSKLLGEQWSRRECPGAFICRSGGIYGRHSPLLKWALSQLRFGKTLEAYTDVRNTPTCVINLAQMLEQVAKLPSCDHVLHTIGSQVVTRFEFFREFAGAFDLPTELISAVEGGKKRQEMLLQSDCSLSAKISQAILKIPFDSVKVGMERVRKLGLDL